MAKEGPTEEELDQGQDLSQGLLRARARHLDQDREPARADADRQSRHRLYRAPSGDDRRRHARGHQAGGQAAARSAASWSRVVGRPAGRHLESARRLASRRLAGDKSSSPALGRGQMPLQQSIDHARARTRSAPHGVARAGLRRRAQGAPAKRSPGCARVMPTAACRCCGCRRKTRRSRRHPRGRPPPDRRRQRHRRCSAPADRASAARRWRSSPATTFRVSGLLRSGRACISSTISMRTPTARCSQPCRSRPRALSRSRNPAAPARR